MYASTMPITETNNTAANESVRIDFLNMMYILSTFKLPDKAKSIIYTPQ